MMSICSKFRILLILCLLPTLSNGETLLFYSEFPPFSYINKGQVNGLYVDVVTSAFDRMKVDFTKETYPFKRALKLASVGKGIVIGILKTKDREKDLSFSQPFYKDRTAIFVRKGSSFYYSNIQDLKGKVIATKLGWSYGFEFDEATQNGLFKVSVGDSRSNFEKLVYERVDAYIDNQLSGWNDSLKFEVDDQIEELPVAVMEGDIYIATRKGSRNKLIHNFNLTIKEMKRDGSYKKILSKYELTR